MKYLIAAIALSVGLFATTGTASAQNYGGHHGSHHGHGDHHRYHGGYSSGGYAPRVGVYSYSVPYYGGYSRGYDPGVYSSPGYYAPSVGVYSAPVYGGSYGGFGYGHHRHHHH